MKYLLAAFAILWLGMIYADQIYGSPYVLVSAGDAAKIFTPRDDSLVVSKADPALRNLGLNPGSIVDLAHMPLGESYRFSVGTTRGAVIPVLVTTNGVTRTVEVRADRPRWTIPLPQRLLSLIVATFSLILAAYLGYRKPGIMMASLILFLGGAVLGWPTISALLSPLPDVLYLPLSWILSDLCNWFPILVLAAFAVRFPHDDARTRTRASMVIDALVIAGFFFGLYRPVGHIVIGSNDTLASALCSLVIIGACIVALRNANVRDRARVGVVFAAMMVGGVGYGISVILVDLTGNVTLLSILTPLSTLLIPLAVAYAILRHRVFDITFVLNRTIVYALTSAAIIVLLAAVEFGVARYLTDLSHVEGIVLQFAIALAVTLGARVVHDRIDKLVDTVFFRTRHQQESALKRFATTAQFFTAEKPLIHDTLGALERYARVQGAAMYLTRDRGLECADSTYSHNASAIDENDLAYVELRAHRESLELHNIDSAFAGDRLYPMYLSGRLVGVVSVGHRESGEQMPPDIHDAIERIASAVASALAAIETDRIREEKAMLEAKLSTIAFPAG